MSIKIIASGVAVLAIIGLAAITKKNLDTIKASIMERSSQDNLLLAKAIVKHDNKLLDAAMLPSIALALSLIHI